ncbi:GTP-dependent dephospho-CoA kinase family protein [[Eubacterium] cellulosolvens]
MQKFVLTEGLRSSLKQPLGRLFRGGGSEVYQQIAQLISLRKPPRVIFVGDAVSRNATARGLRRDVVIIDNKEMRVQTKPLGASTGRTFRVRNEPGTISSNAWVAVDEAVEAGNAVMIVDGEEDLLTLVAMAVAPLGSFVIYGQPGEGVVLVEVDEEARKKVHSFLEGMNESG